MILERQTPVMAQAPHEVVSTCFWLSWLVDLRADPFVRLRCLMHPVLWVGGSHSTQGWAWISSGAA